MRRRRPPALLLALLLSALLHASLWLLLPRGLPAPPRPREVVEIEVELPTPKSPPAARAQRARPGAGATRPPPPSRTSPQLQRGGQHGARATGARAAEPGSRSSTSWGSAGDSPRVPDLSLPFSPSTAPTLHDPRGRLDVGESIAETAEAKAVRAKATVDGWLADARAEARVERGLVDPYFSREKLALEGAFASELRRGSPHLLADFVKSWSSAARRYGANGSPRGPGAVDDLAHREELPNLGGPPGDPRAPWAPNQGAIDAMQTMSGLSGENGAALVALVEIREGPRGELLGATLQRSSGDRGFDAWVLARIPLGLAKLAPPPASGEGLSPVGSRALWAFEGRLSFLRDAKDVKLSDDWWYLPLAVATGTMAGSFDVGSADPTFVDLRAAHFVVDAKLLRVY